MKKLKRNFRIDFRRKLEKFDCTAWELVKKLKKIFEAVLERFKERLSEVSNRKITEKFGTFLEKL